MPLKSPVSDPRSNEDPGSVRRALRLLGVCHKALARARNEAQLLKCVCRAIVDEGGYRLVWVGFAEADEARSVRPAAQAGFEDGYLETLKITWADTERGRGPTGTAIRCGKTVVARDMLSSPAFAPWRDEIAKRGYQASIALPLKDGRRTIGALNVYSAAKNAFPPAEVKLLEGLAGNLSIGILALRQRAAAERAEIGLRESEELYRLLFRTSQDAILLTSPSGAVLAANPAASRVLGRSEEEIKKLGRAGFVDEADPRLASALEERARTGNFFGELNMLRGDGTKFPAELSTALFKDRNGRTRTSMIIRDLTERKRTQASLIASEARFRSLFENMMNGMAYCRMIFEEGRPRDFIYLSVNRAFEAQTGLKDVVGKRVTEVIPGIRESDPKLFAIYGRVARSGRPEKFETFVASLQMWFSVSVYSPERGYFVAVFDVITERKKKEEELEKAYRELQAAIDGSVLILASTVEKKDPYTAGHQRRVARIAEAIGVELGMPKTQIQGLRMAGLIHDIGKIGVPGEILSKPGRLTNIEFEIVKSHSQAGYEILQPINFPWPLARIVLQHHERLDGSGYPSGISGEEMIVEAKIIAVADVVEAMSYHRPYREAQGVPEALQELESGRGRLYEASAVDACLRLYREKGFQPDA